MAAVFIQSAVAANNGNPTSIAVTFTNKVQKGNFIFIAIAVDVTTANPVASIRDNLGNVYTKIASTASAASTLDRWYTKNIRGGKAITITATATSPATPDWNIIVREYSGVDINNPLDKSAVATGSSTTPSSGASAATTTENEVVIGSNASDNGTDQTYTLGAGYSNLVSKTDVVTFTDEGTEDKIISATGAQTATFTLGTSAGWVCAVDTFRAASTGGINLNRLRPRIFAPGNAR
jgi:hypothetical protein